MDKYEYRVKTEQMLEHMERKQYKKAMELADTIDWRRVKNATMLNSVSEIYEANGEFQKSRDILFVAFNRSNTSRKIVYRLGLMALKIQDTEEAADCYEEFVKLAPKDPNQYILRYKILRAQGAPLTEQISALEDFKKAEYVEKWAYELAKLYHEAGMTAECLEECDDLILWFSEGKYVYQAMELKMNYKPLTPLQQEKYDSRPGAKRKIRRPMPARAVQNPRAAQILNKPEVKDMTDMPILPGEDEEADVPTDATRRIPTDELEQRLKASTAPAEDVAAEVAAFADGDVAEEDMVTSDAETEEVPTTGSAIKTIVKGATLEEALANGVAMAANIGKEETKKMEQKDEELRIAGQMKIEDILQQWEEKQKDHVDAIEKQREKDEERLQKERAEAEARMEAERLAVEQTTAEVEARKKAEAEQVEEESKTVAPAKPALKTAIKKAPVLSDDIRQLVEELEGRVADTDEEDELDIFEEKEPVKEEPLQNTGSLVDALRMDDDDDEDEDYEDEDFEDEEVEEDDFEEEELEEDDLEEEELEEDDFEEEEIDEDDLEEEEVEEDDFEDEEIDEDDFEDEEYDDEEYEDEEYDDEEYEDEEYEDEEYEDEEYEDEEYDDEEYEDDDEDDFGIADFEEEFEAEFDEEDEDDFDDVDFDDFDEDDFEEDDFEEEDFEEDDFEEEELEEAQLGGVEFDTGDIELPEEEFDEGEFFDEGDLDESSFFDDGDDPEEEDSDEPLELDEPSEAEIQKRIKKSKGSGVPFDTGFVVTGRYDLSATSEIGLKAGLTEEQKKLFSYFVPVRGMSEQIVEVLDNDRRAQREGTSKTGNLLVVGRKGSGKTVLAVDIVKAIQKQRNLKQGKVAIVTGESLNKKELANIIQKLRGGAIIIEKAGKLNSRTVKELNQLMEKKTGEMLFVLEDQRKPLERVLTANPEFKKKFTSKLELPVFINDELVTFGQTYAKENGYKLDEMGILALYSRIDVMQREDHAVTVAEVKEMMDDAIAHSQKANVKHLARRVFGKSTDDSDRIILKEEDFRV